LHGVDRYFEGKLAPR